MDYTRIILIRIKPVGVLYRPSESKLKNAKTKDYLGKAVCISWVMC